MNNLPRGADLLRIARETLMSEVRPLVTGDARYAVAMIANAMAIALRECDAGDAAAQAALARTDRLYGREPRELGGAALREALLANERRLACDIRAGRFDADGKATRAMLEHLRESVRSRLAVSNPRSL